MSTQSGMAGSAARTAALVSQVYTTSRYLGVCGHGSPNTREVTARLQEAAWAPEHRAATWRSVVGWMQRVDQEPDEAAPAGQDHLSSQTGPPLAPYLTQRTFPRPTLALAPHP